MRLRRVGPHITLERAGASLGGRAILRDVSLELAPGEILGIAGPNGSGKSTLLRLLATLIAPDSGSGHVLGARLGTAEVYGIRRLVGLMSHTPAVIAELTIRENLEHSARLIGEDPARIETALRVVGLEDAATVRGEASSFGMLRRTEAARLLITMPRLLLLDEAFSGLDVDAQELIDALIGRTIERKGAVVIVSHDEAQLSNRTSRVMTLAAGRLEVLA